VNIDDIGQPGHLAEFDKTDKIFTNPSSEVTQRYVSGRFG
jgi:phosphate transport system ATP-binding protein